MTKKVLLALDESDHSKRAFEYYVSDIFRADDELILLHIFNPPPPPAMSSKGKMSRMGMGMSISGEEHSHPFGHDFFLSDPKSEHWIAWRNTVEKKIQELKTYLNVFEKRCEEKKITCHTVLHNGQPGEAICEIAEERDVTLIVLGSRGLNKIRRTFLGSVSDYVIHHCKKPVLVVPQPK